tara:strand:+ start:106 stop:504 length:399 start_codon:yes stop_codon:yes gene_type:complete
MATDSQIEELLQVFVNTMANYSMDDLEEIIENLLDNSEKKDALQNIEELKKNIHLYYLHIIEMCIRYKSKEINLYQRFKDLTQKIDDKENFYAEDKVSLQKDYLELKDLTEILGLALGKDETISKSIGLHLD